MKNQLLTKIRDRSATIAVVGLGYVGLPLAVAFASYGFNVWGIDVDEGKVNQLNGGESYVKDVASLQLAPLVAAGKFCATHEFEALACCDVAVVAVPTPLGKTRDPDMKYVISAGGSVARNLHAGMLVVLESTTYPGTTEELLLPMFAQACGLDVGKDFFLAFSPERIDPGNTRFTITDTPKVVGGVTLACREVACALYGTVIQEVVPVTSTQTAEMVKLLENTFRAVNIALANETAIMCDRLGIDVWEVIDAAASKPYGFMRFAPGPGVGGHCIPLDPYYLSWKLKTLNYNARFIQLAGEINSEMPRYWVDKVVDALNDAGKPLKGSCVLVLGVSYKRDIDDVRESPALDVIELLRQRGANVRYHDPFVPRIQHNGLLMKAEEELNSALQLADCVLVVTDHSTYDWTAISCHARLIVDTRNSSPVVANKARASRSDRYTENRGVFAAEE